MTFCLTGAVSLASMWMINHSWLSTKALGAAVLIAVVAIVLGYVVSLVWPKNFNPGLFGFLAAVAFVGGLAFADVMGAGLAIVLVIVMAALLAVLGISM